jgi:hypothetical protein
MPQEIFKVFLALAVLVLLFLNTPIRSQYPTPAVA